MMKVFIALQITALTVLTSFEERIRNNRDERGSVTIQEVLWAVAAIGLVGIVVAAYKFFLTNESGKIK